MVPENESGGPGTGPEPPLEPWPERPGTDYCFTFFFPLGALLAVPEEEEDDEVEPLEAPGDRSTDRDAERVLSSRWMVRSAPLVLKRACEP